jgi:hypothetical protein
LYLEERETPYTPDEVKTLYPALTEIEYIIVARIEERFPRWHLWPDVEYPQMHVWYARRNHTSMPPLVTGKIGDIPGEIAYWISQNSSPAWGTT